MCVKRIEILNKSEMRSIKASYYYYYYYVNNTFITFSCITAITYFQHRTR